MIEIGILYMLLCYNHSPWAFHSYGASKKTKDIQIMTDFEKINEATERNPFPIPRIIQMLHKLDKFKSSTALDLYQGFYQES